MLVRQHRKKMLDDGRRLFDYAHPIVQVRLAASHASQIHFGRRMSTFLEQQP